jgi:hypothetical protein
LLIVAAQSKLARGCLKLSIDIYSLKCKDFSLFMTSSYRYNLPLASWVILSELELLEKTRRFSNPKIGMRTEFSSSH